MTTDEIARLRALRAAGTPGMWMPVNGACGIEAGQADVIGIYGSFGCNSHYATRADLDLMAAAVNALPALLDEIERLRRLCDVLDIDPDAHLRQHCSIDPETLREVRGESKVYAVETVGNCRRCGVDLRLGVSMETAQRHGLLADAAMPMCSVAKTIEPVLL